MSTTSPQAINNSTLPALLPDLPASLVILAVYLACAIGMVIRLQQSHRKFRLGIFLIIVCTSRIITFSLRSAWAVHPFDKNLSIAATVFVSAGAIILVIVDMQLVIRLAKSRRPELQLSKTFVRLTTVMQMFLVPLLIMTIVPAIQNILTTDAAAKRKDAIVLKISLVYIAVYSCLPVFITPLLLLVPASDRSIAIRMPLKVGFVTAVSTLVGLEMTLRCANVFSPTTVASWYSHHGSFYIFTPMLELLCIIAHLLFDLPHAFGDSNVAVLDIINSPRQGDGKEEEGISVDSRQSALSDALQETTTRYRPGMWTRISEEDA